ncbi:GIY-YIG nuclease family protein [Azospirillum sp. A26]|uniref:GIY-YIG nuclease family protein n=1 Tax=Azospirillum sp. A26 TaxID=3160607 RepID=UPI003671D468
MSKSVYVIGPESGPLKIGISSDINKRLAALQTGSADKLSVHYSTDIPDGKARAVEAAAHAMLRERRKSGEWFDITLDEAQDAIREAMEELDKPHEAPVRINPKAGNFLVDFLERHDLTQAEFGSWFGRARDSIWRHTLPPENKHHRPVSDELAAFCEAYELLPDPKRKRLVLRLKEVQSEKALSGGAGVRREKGDE